MNTRREHDNLGEIEVPADALYGAQTARAVLNFQISGYRMPRPFLRTLAMIKGAAASVNAALGLLDREIASAIVASAAEIEQGLHDKHFPIDVFQTGSGTSTNMNANEVIAALAARRVWRPVHPNDHVNLGQSSNDVIPSALHISATMLLSSELLPALAALADAIRTRAREFDDVVKTGRTHLMDAVPIRLSQELSAWDMHVRDALRRLEIAGTDLLRLPLGGTAVGTGLNTHPEFGARVAEAITIRTGLSFTVAPNKFAEMAGQDAALHVSAQLRGAAVALMKIANDLRWMNSGPVAGLAEISLPALQPGSSMMPGKVNPVIPESVAMSCAHVIGNDAAIAVAAQAGSFQLNTMLPLIAWSLLASIRILSGATRALTTKAIAGFTVNRERVAELAARNPILATALAPAIGYESSAKIAQEAMASGRSVYEVARERTELTELQLRELLDPARMTEPTAAGSRVP